MKRTILTLLSTIIFIACIAIVGTRTGRAANTLNMNFGLATTGNVTVNGAISGPIVGEYRRAVELKRIARAALALQSPILKEDPKPLFGNFAKELQVVRSKTDIALRALADYWTRSFRSMNRTFIAPKVVSTENAGVQAHYDPASKTIFYNLNFFVYRMREAIATLRKGDSDKPLTHSRFKSAGIDGDMAFITILAHEYGHAVQHQLNKLNGPSRDVELQADSLAGAFAGDAKKRGLLEEGDRDEATYVLLWGRDPTGTSPNHPNAHAPGADRIEYFNRGYNGGLNAALWR